MIRTEHEEVGLVLHGLVILLCSHLRPRVCCMSLHGLKDNVQCRVNSQCLGQVDVYEVVVPTSNMDKKRLPLEIWQHTCSNQKDALL